MARTEKSILPPMPFGQTAAQSFGDLNQFTDAISAGVEHPMYFDALGEVQQFQHSTSSVNINGTCLIASVTTPFHYRVEQSEQLYLMIPFHGEATARVSAHDFPFENVREVFLSPNITRSGESSILSMIQTMLEIDRLIATAKTMFGDSAAQRIMPKLDHVNILAFRQGPIRYDQLFKRICLIIDDLQLNESLLALQRISTTASIARWP